MAWVFVFLPLPADAFAPVAGKPYFVYQLDKQNDGNYPNLRTLYVNGRIAEISRTAEHRTCPAFEGYTPTQYTWEKEYRHRLYIPLAAVEEAGEENCRGAEFHIGWSGSSKSTTSTMWIRMTVLSGTDKFTWPSSFEQTRKRVEMVACI